MSFDESFSDKCHSTQYLSNVFHSVQRLSDECHSSLSGSLRNVILRNALHCLLLFKTPEYNVTTLF